MLVESVPCRLDLAVVEQGVLRKTTAIGGHQRTRLENSSLDARRFRIFPNSEIIIGVGVDVSLDVVRCRVIWRIATDVRLARLLIYSNPVKTHDCGEYKFVVVDWSSDRQLLFIEESGRIN